MRTLGNTLIIIMLCAASYCKADRRALLETLRDPVASGTVIPSDISGLHAWYEATSLVTNSGGSSPPANGDQITAWGDKSGNGRHLAHIATGAPFFTNSYASFSGAIRFKGTEYLEAGFSALSSCTVFVAYGAPHGLGSFGFLYDSTNSAARCYTYKNTSDVILMGSGGSDVSGDTAISSGSTGVTCAVHNGAGTDEFWRNGTQKGTGDSGNQSLDGLRVGCNQATTLAWGGDIAVVIVYNRVLNSTEIGQVFTYIKNLTSAY